LLKYSFSRVGKFIHFVGYYSPNQGRQVRKKNDSKISHKTKPKTFQNSF